MAASVRVLIIALAAALGCGKPALANETFSASWLATLCDPKLELGGGMDSLDETLTCMMFISGFRQGVLMAEAVSKTKSGISCEPEKVPNTEVAKLVVRFARAHPEHMKHTGAELLALTLNDAFPCR